MINILNEDQDMYYAAPIGKRYLAALIDYSIYFLAMVLLTILFGKTYSGDEGSGFALEGLPAFFGMLLWFAIPIMEGLTGQTIGKMIFNIKVLQLNGANLPMGSALLRHIFDFVDGLPILGVVGLIVASNNTSKQRVGDLIANSIVVTRTKPTNISQDANNSPTIF